MKRYYISVPRDYELSASVEAEDQREARFEAIKRLAFKLLNDFMPLDVSEGEDVYPCGECAGFFPQGEINLSGEKLLCEMCAAYEHAAAPEFW